MSLQKDCDTNPANDPDYVDRQKKRVEATGPDRAGGLGGLDVEIAAQIITLADKFIEKYAVDPKFANYEAKDIAAALYRGLTEHGITEAQLAHQIGEFRK